MINNKIIRGILVAFLLCGLVLIAGCSIKPARPTETVPQATNNELTAETGKETETTQTELAVDDASLVSLRQALVETPQLFAAAYLGYPEIIDQDIQADPFATS